MPNDCSPVSTPHQPEYEAQEGTTGEQRYKRPLDAGAPKNQKAGSNKAQGGRERGQGVKQAAARVAFDDVCAGVGNGLGAGGQLLARTAPSRTCWPTFAASSTSR